MTEIKLYFFFEEISCHCIWMCNTFQHYVKHKSHRALVSAWEAEAGRSLFVSESKAKPDMPVEFQDSQGCVERPSGGEKK